MRDSRSSDRSVYVAGKRRNISRLVEKARLRKIHKDRTAFWDEFDYWSRRIL